MRLLPALCLTLACAVPATAETVLSEASGNWAGASGEGFTFLARLTQNKDRILALEVLDTGDGSILQIVTDYADETGSGRTVTQIQFIDNQFTLVGYHHQGERAGQAFDCAVDLWNMTATEAGKTRVLEPVGFEALNASDWTWDAAYERGFCHRAE